MMVHQYDRCSIKGEEQKKAEDFFPNGKVSGAFIQIICRETKFLRKIKQFRASVLLSVHAAHNRDPKQFRCN